MATGLGLLRLPPATFWALTPKELAAALKAVLGPVGVTAPARSDLARLMQRFPDA